jgi:hypothetical protein
MWDGANRKLHYSFKDGIMLSRSVIGFKIIFMKLSILFCDDDFLEDLLGDLDDDRS